MIRHLAPLPANYSLGQLYDLSRARWPGVMVNVVTTNLAAYFEDNAPPTSVAVAAWQADVAAHVPVSPTPEQQHTTATSNEATLRQQSADALATNKTYVALPSPTNAQNTSQIKALSRQMNGVIRLLIGRLDATD